MKKILTTCTITCSAAITAVLMPHISFARTFADFEAHPPIHVQMNSTADPKGLIPTDIRQAYNLPSSGGKGTVALIEAYDSPSLATDLAGFSSRFSLKPCTTSNGCLEIHKMKAGIPTNAGWQMETALDAEWAHAVAPSTKILVVEAASAAGGNLLKAVDYARARTDIVAISMSWGGPEFAGETKFDSHFTAQHHITFTASSGDNGTGPNWPAASANIIAVGGTSLSMNSGGVVSEKAWSGSGGGVSLYENEPIYQVRYSIPRTSNRRAIPDVSFAADPAHGFSVFHNGAWSIVGGTSAGAPQWAAMATLGNSFSPLDLYQAKASVAYQSFFRDITSGSNGDCTYYCTARRHYDYVTGLGSPLTYKY